MFTLDLHDAGYWLIRQGPDIWPAGTHKGAAQTLITRLNEAHKPNLKVEGNTLLVCWNEHHRASSCACEPVIQDVYGRILKLRTLIKQPDLSDTSCVLVPFVIFLARLLEDGLASDVETGLFQECLALAHEQTVQALTARLAEERAASESVQRLRKSTILRLEDLITRLTPLPPPAT